MSTIRRPTMNLVDAPEGLNPPVLMGASSSYVEFSIPMLTSGPPGPEE